MTLARFFMFVFTALVCGLCYKTDKLMAEAVDRGFAEWRTGTLGLKEFKWKEAQP